MPDYHKILHADNYNCLSSISDNVVFEGHLSSSIATLLVRGFNDKIVAYVVPAESWLGLCFTETTAQIYLPFAEMQVKTDGLKTLISSGSEKEELFIKSDMLPLLAQVLFSRLIEFSPEE